MRKYFEMMAVEWKSAMAYRADAWLRAAFSVFTVALAYLMWKAVFRGEAVYGGMTLPEMTSYYLIAGILSPLTQGDGATMDFTDEIRTGRYAKYIVRPVSPLGTFLSMNFAKALLPLASGAVALSVAAALFRGYFVVPTAQSLLYGVPVVLLAGLFNGLVNYIIVCSTFRFTDISGFFIIKDLLKNLLAGGLIPLHLLLGSVPGLMLFSPFSYIIYYPVMLLLGKTDAAPQTALLILCGWVLVALLICRWLERVSPRRFEGVGL